MKDADNIYAAIVMGYWMIDTASMYGNAGIVGKAIKKAIDDQVVTWEELYIITKVWPTEVRNVEKTLDD